MLCLPAMAVGPVQGEVGAVWWANNFDASAGLANVSSDAGAPGFHAELWIMNKYGFRAERFSSDLDDIGGASADYTSIDVLWRPISPTGNNFFAVGLGWQEMDLATVGLDGDTSGVRVAAEGRVGLGALFYAYAQGSYFPSLDEANASNPQLGRFEDLDGHEYEIGVSWKVFPFMSMRAGYRTYNVNFNETGIDPLLGIGTELSGEVESDGFLLGLSARF